MSGINGDKARFNRLRKQKIQRRMRNRVMYGQLRSPSANSGAAQKTGTPAAVSKRTVTADS